MTGTEDGQMGDEGQVYKPQGKPPRALVLTPRSPQTLLWEAHEVELQRQKEAEKLERQLALPTAEQAATQVSHPGPPSLLPRACPQPGPSPGP